MLPKKRLISIFGSTGSIGVQTLEVLAAIPEHFEINWLTVNSNIELLKNQIKKFQPKGIVIRDSASYEIFVQSPEASGFNGKILS